MQNISAVIIVKNGAAYLERVIAPLRQCCAEVVVLDSDSTDDTCAIAARCGARVEKQSFLGYGPQKRHAVALAQHDWVLSIDADEIIDDACVAAITALPLNDPDVAYQIRRRNFIGANEIRFGVWSPDWCLRLFNRRVTNFNEALIHESVNPVKHIRRLTGSMIHYSYRSPADVFARMANYTRLKAERYHQENRRASAMVIAARAAWGFFRSYIMKQGFRDGALGVVVALSVAIDSVAALSAASLREAHK
jgi:glycosyltransferase involved in cell wall biosynthesis